MNKYQLLLVPVFNEKESRFAKGWKMLCLRMEQNLLNDGEKKLIAKYLILKKFPKFGKNPK